MVLLARVYGTKTLIFTLNLKLNLDGLYLYVNSYYIKYPSETALLVSPLISAFQQSMFCLKFWYHMYSDSTASNVIQIKS